MNNKQRKQRVEILENLVNAQQELIMIYSEIMDVIDASDHAVATTVDAWENSIIGKDLHEVRELHFDREEELTYEISGYFDKLEGKEPSEKPPEDSDI